MAALMAFCGFVLILASVVAVLSFGFAVFLMAGGGVFLIMLALSVAALAFSIFFNIWVLIPKARRFASGLSNTQSPNLRG